MIFTPSITSSQLRGHDQIIRAEEGREGGETQIHRRVCDQSGLPLAQLCCKQEFNWLTSSSCAHGPACQHYPDYEKMKKIPIFGVYHTDLTVQHHEANWFLIQRVCGDQIQIMETMW